MECFSIGANCYKSSESIKHSEHMNPVRLASSFPKTISSMLSSLLLRQFFWAQVFRFSLRVIYLSSSSAMDDIFALNTNTYIIKECSDDWSKIYIITKVD